nr:pepcterm_polyde: polysaccharide deacetylase family protein, PEP-CTERM locus [uncultured bacterium]
MQTANILSVDVEDWFHILELETSPDISVWDSLESRVCQNTEALLDLFDSTGAKATFFFLGWTAQRHPALVRSVHARGHEVACHGYGHQLIYTQTPDQFFTDISKAKSIIEDVIGQPILGYRAPGFSIIARTPWAFDQIARAGFSYDSSVFPSSRGHGGISSARMEPHILNTAYGALWELPVSVTQLLGKRLCFFGGGYLRLFPYFLIRRMAQKVNRQGRPVIYYVHPREIDPDHPRIRMGLWRYFKSYVGLATTRIKIEKILHENRLITLREELAILKSRGFGKPTPFALREIADAR